MWDAEEQVGEAGVAATGRAASPRRVRRATASGEEAEQRGEVPKVARR